MTILKSRAFILRKIVLEFKNEMIIYGYFIKVMRHKILKRPLTDAEELTYVYLSNYKNIIFLPRGSWGYSHTEALFCIVMKGKVSKRKFKIYMNSLQNIRKAGIEKKREKGKNFYSISSTSFQPIQSSYNTKVYSETQTAFLSSFERNINLNITILVKLCSYQFNV